MRSERGFTLVEVLVALIVAGLLLPTLLLAYASQADGVARIRDKSMAQWVASNRMAQLRIETARTRLVFQGERQGVASMAGRDWHWWLRSGEVTEAGIAGFYRVEIRVAAREGRRDRPLHTLTGFLVRPG